MKATKNHKKFWVLVAEYYNQDITENQLEMYSQNVATYSLEDLQRAFNIYAKKNARVKPMPADLIHIIEPPVDNSQDPKLIANQIEEALNNFGYWESDEMRARDYLCEIGWRFIESKGGWRKISQAYRQGHLNPFFFKEAQDITGIYLTKIAHGQELPQIKAPPELKLLFNNVKNIEGKK